MSATAATIDGQGGSDAAPVSAYHESLLRSPLFLGMIMFLGSEIMLFGSFFTIFFYLRFTHHPWPPTGIDVPKKPTGINTAILISSSFTMHWALVSIKRNSRFGLARPSNHVPSCPASAAKSPSGASTSSGLRTAAKPS